MKWKCKCAYDGTDFFGWQSQIGGNTIQDILENRLKDVLKEHIRIHGSGRTDAGVHAKGQVFHFDANWKYGDKKLLQAISTKLDPSIQLITMNRAPSDFHARYSVTYKRYVYNIFVGYANPMETRYCWSLGEGNKLNIELMQETAQDLIGTHDFSQFACKAASKENPIKDMKRFDIFTKGPRVKIVTEASGYLYKMVRRLVGAFVEIGLEKQSPKLIKQALKNKANIKRIPTAPAQGLCLEKVFYP